MFNQNARTQSLTAKKNGLSFVLILSALMAVTSLSTDIYLPTMPVMAKDLQFAVNIVGLMAVSMVNRRLVHRYPLEALLKNAVFIATIAAIVLAVTTGLGVGGITVIVGAVFVFFSMNGIIAATSTACALDAVPNLAGSASALMGALQYGSGIISSLLLAMFSDGTPWTMGWIIGLFTAASALMALTFKAKK